VVNAAKVAPGRSVAVFGAGGIGLNAIQSAVLAGAEKVIAVDLKDNKLAYARQFGATHTVNASAGDPVEQIKALTGGRGVDYALEAVGLPQTIRQAYDALAKCGIAVVIGISPNKAEVSIPALSLSWEEKILTGTLYGSGHFRQDILKLVDLLHAGKLKLGELLTRTYPIDQINEAYDALERGEVARSVVLHS